MIPFTPPPIAPRPHNKAEFQHKLQELTSNMRQMKLDEEGALTNIKLIDIVELAFGPGIDVAGVAKELTSWLIYAKNKNLVETTDIEAIEDLAYKAGITPEKRRTDIERNLDDVMNQIRRLNPETALTDFYTAIQKEDESTINSILQNNLPALQAAMQRKTNSFNPLHTAVSTNNKRLMQILIEYLPNKFKAAMLETDADGSTPLSLASEKGLSDFVEMMALCAPDEFKQAVLVSDKSGNTPLHKGKLPSLEIIEKHAPNEFLIGLETLNNFEKSPIFTQRNSLDITKFFFKKYPDLFLKSNNLELPPLSRVKALRSEDYRAKMDIFKTNKEMINVAKEISRRKAASHAFHIDGVTVIRQKNSENEVKLDLEGHSMPQWFRLMGKTLGQFQETYPGILTENEISHLMDAFKLNSAFSSSEEVVDRIKKRLPTIVQAGFGNDESGGHAVTFVFFGDRFIICNRGAGAEIAIDIYHFDPQKIDIRTLMRINMINAGGSLENYERLISEFLPDELDLYKTEDDELIQAWSEFPDQTVGNCSFVSPITSVYALLLFSTLGRTSPVNEAELEPLVTATVEKYQKWLGFLQITILERLITPLTDKNRTITPDHHFIREVLKNAYSLELDETNSKKLEEITEIYQSTLEPKEVKLLKIECLAWKNLPRIPNY